MPAQGCDKMLLDIIMLVFIWVGVMLNLFGSIFKGTFLDGLPWSWIAIFMIIMPIILIRYRGYASKWWCMLDFPNAREKRGIVADGNLLYPEPLYNSIESYLKTKDDKYYKDTGEGYFSGGHDTRLIEKYTAHTATPERAIFTKKLGDEGFFNYDEVKDAVIKDMIFLKDGDKYLLTGTDIPPNPMDIDIKNNMAHNQLFEELADKYYIKTAGQTYSLKQYKQFQERKASPDQVGSIIHYVKAMAAMRAAKVKKGMGGTWKIALIAILLILGGLVILYLFSSGAISF